MKIIDWLYEYLVPHFVTDSVFFDEEGLPVYCEPLKTYGKEKKILIPSEVLSLPRFTHEIISGLIVGGVFVWTETLYCAEFEAKDGYSDD